jgi:WD40 repeat protein
VAAALAAPGLGCAAFSEDGRLALTGHRDGSVAVWDLDSGGELARYRQHDGPVAGVAVGPGGKLGLSAGEADGEVWLYRLPRPGGR